MGTRWFQVCRHPLWDPLHISIKEFFPIYLAIRTWGPELTNTALTFHCDNQAIVEVLNNATTLDLQHFIILHSVMLLALHFNLSLVAIHYVRKLNVLADFLSRHQVSPDQSVRDGLDPVPTAASHEEQ